METNIEHKVETGNLQGSRGPREVHNNWSRFSRYFAQAMGLLSVLRFRP